MIFRAGFFSFISIRIATLLLCFAVTTFAMPGPGKREPVIVENVSITGSPISDLEGNVVGVTIPLKRAGRLLLLEGTIDNVIGNFILDTGSSGLVLNTTYSVMPSQSMTKKVAV